GGRASPRIRSRERFDHRRERAVRAGRRGARAGARAERTRTRSLQRSRARTRLAPPARQAHGRARRRGVTMQASVVSGILEEYGQITRRSVEHYLSVQSGRGAEYLPGALRDYPARGGRSLRSSLTIAVARAFGASVEDAVNSAAAIELFHNALLVHDDIEDA